MTAFAWLVEHTVIRGWSLFAVALVLLVIAAVCAAITVVAFHHWLLAFVVCPVVAVRIWRAAL